MPMAHVTDIKSVKGHVMNRQRVSEMNVWIKWPILAGAFKGISKNCVYASEVQRKFYESEETAMKDEKDETVDMDEETKKESVEESDIDEEADKEPDSDIEDDDDEEENSDEEPDSEIDETKTH
jgi:hypothetical protein